MTAFWCWLTRHMPRVGDHAEAEAALIRATAARDRAASQWPEVETVTTSLRRLREKNHFIEGFKKTL